MVPPITVPPSASYVPSGHLWESIDETVDLSSAAASFSLVDVIPKNAIVTGVALSIPTTIAAATATKIGVGRVTSAASPSKYLLSAGLTAAQIALPSFSNPVITDTNGETVGIFACANDGTAAGTIGGGAGQYVEVRIIYLLCPTIN